MKETAKLVVVMLVLAVSGVFAADWPWVYGPARNSTSDQKGLLRTWPAEGPKVLWTTPVGIGFGGAAVSGGQVYLLDRDEKVGDNLRVFDLASGKELWNFAYDAPGSFMFAGSRTTPTVDGDHVYTSGPVGDLYCINTKTRKPVWQKNIWKDFGGGGAPPVGHRPASADLRQPGDRRAADGPGGSGRLRQADRRTEMEVGAAVRASRIREPLHRQGRRRRPPRHDRRPAWDGAAPPSDGSVNGLDPRSGKVLWSYMGWQCPIPVPQPVDAGEGRILITGGYNAGSAMFQVQKKGDGSYGVKELFKNPDFGAHTQPPLLYKDHFYSHFTVNERSDGLAAMSHGRPDQMEDRPGAGVRPGRRRSSPKACC